MIMGERVISALWTYSVTFKSSIVILSRDGETIDLSPLYVRSGLNYHYFHIIGDGHQPNSRGLYTHYKDSLLKVGWPSPIQRV